MPPKKKEAKAKKGPVDTGPGQSPAELLETYKAYCKRIGLEPHPQITGSLTNEENVHLGKQICVDSGFVNGDGSNLTLPNPNVPPLGPGGCRALATACMGIGFGMPKHPETGLPIIYKQLQELRIWGSNIGDDGALSLSELLRLGGAELQLAYLELFNNGIGATGAFALGRSLSCMMNRSLITLSLDYNMTLKSEGVAALCQGLRTNSTLKKLSLRYCELDEDAGGPLGEMLAFTKSGLNILDIMGNELGGTGLLDFCGGLKRNKSLVSLVLADNNINVLDEDIKGLEKLADALIGHTTITSVDLVYNRFGDKGGAILLPVIDPVGGNKAITTFRVDASLPDEIFKKLNKSGGGGGKGKKGKKKSDERLKCNVVEILGATEDRPALYQFCYKSDVDEIVHEGYMAQDLLAFDNEECRNSVSVDVDEEDGVHYQVDYDLL